MNAERQRQTGDFVKKAVEQKVMKNSIEATAKVLAAGIRKVKPLGIIQSQHDDLMAMPAELRSEFIDALGKRQFDTSLFQGFKDRLKLFIPIVREKMFWEKAKDGTLSGLLMLGLIGKPADQEQLAAYADPGAIENIAKKVLPWIAMVDLEPATREGLELIIAALKGKGMALDTLRLTRKHVEAGTDEDALGAALGSIKDASNYTARMPADKDHKTPEEMHVAAATGPVPATPAMKENLDLELGKTFGPSETPEA